MSREFHLTKEMGWHRYEEKTFLIPIVDAADVAVDVSATAMRFVILDEQGGSVIVSKTTVSGITVTNPNSTARVAIASPADYASLEPGPYRYELWDTTNELLLAYGDAHLNPGIAPA